MANIQEKVVPPDDSVRLTPEPTGRMPAPHLSPFRVLSGWGFEAGLGRDDRVAQPAAKQRVVAARVAAAVRTATASARDLRIGRLNSTLTVLPT